MVSAKVFISSVILGLEKEREAAEQTISSLELLPNRFETWPAYPDKPPEICIQEVADSEIFILILGETISDIVIKEYKTAKENIPHRILVFVKDISRTADAETFFNRVRKEYNYKKFSSANELSKQVKNGIQSLFFTLLKTDKDITPEHEEEVLLEIKNKQIKPKNEFKKDFRLYDGDIITGIVDELYSEPINIYLLSQKNYVKKKTKMPYNYFGEEYTCAHSFDYILIDEGGTWYLIIENNALYYSRHVYIRISVIR